MPPTVAVTTQADHPVASASTVDYLYRAAEKFGAPTLILCGVLYWIRTDFVKPLLDAHYRFVDEIKDSSDQHNEKLDRLIDLLRSQNKMMMGDATVKIGDTHPGPAG